MNQYVSDIRAFNRFYTAILGLLDQHVYDSKFTLSEVRILYEIHHQKDATAVQLATMLQMDKGYLSRILAKFEKQKVLKKKRSELDQRVVLLALTDKGTKEFEKINKVSKEQIEKLVARVRDAELKDLVDHMLQIQKILSSNENRSSSR